MFRADPPTCPRITGTSTPFPPRPPRRAGACGRSGLGHNVCKRSELLVTELVANVVRHADLESHEQIELAVRDAPGGRLHVEVIDPGGGFDLDEVPPADGFDGGWGLRLLEQLSDDWGVQRADDRTCVWFEVSV